MNLGLEIVDFNYPVFRHTLSDLYQFQLFFPQEELKKILNFQFKLHKMTLTDLICRQEDIISIEVDRLMKIMIEFVKEGKILESIKYFSKAIELNPSLKNNDILAEIKNKSINLIDNEIFQILLKKT